MKFVEWNEYAIIQQIHWIYSSTNRKGKYFEDDDERPNIHSLDSSFDCRLRSVGKVLSFVRCILGIKNFDEEETMTLYSKYEGHHATNHVLLITTKNSKYDWFHRHRGDHIRIRKHLAIE